MPPAFSYPCLLVSDLKKARAFYHDMFGFEVVNREDRKGSASKEESAGPGGPDGRGYMMKAYDCFLELVEAPGPPVTTLLANFRDTQDPGLHHLTFHVDDCWSEYWRFQELGGSTMGIPAGDARHGYSVYCRDPFGNLTELTQEARPETPRSHLPDNMTMAR